MATPIKRHIAMQALSRDHHHGLLLCWKIREGRKRAVDPGRIMTYVKWFWTNQLKPHFEEEEKHVFTILPDDHPHIRQALAEHRRLRELMEVRNATDDVLGDIEKELDAHIRFEERVLFNEIQDKASEIQLQKIAEIHAENPACDTWEDEWWLPSVT
jgi:hypothetical protein